MRLLHLSHLFAFTDSIDLCSHARCIIISMQTCRRHNTFDSHAKTFLAQETVLSVTHSSLAIAGSILNVSQNSLVSNALPNSSGGLGSAFTFCSFMSSSTHCACGPLLRFRSSLVASPSCAFGCSLPHAAARSHQSYTRRSVSAHR